MDIESVPKSALNEAIQIASALKRLRETNAALDFKPYPKQRDFLYSSSKTKVLLGANRCLAGEQEIFDPIADRWIRVDSIEGNFHVWAWDGTKRVVAEAGVPFRKGLGDLYRVLLGDGTELKISRDHQFLASEGFSQIDVESPHECGVCRLPSTLDSGQLARLLGVLHLIRKELDSQYDCLGGLHSHDEPPRVAPAFVRGVQPSRGDVLGHKLALIHRHALSPLGVHRHKQEHSHHCLACDHPSSLDAPPLDEALFCQEIAQIFDKVSRPVWHRCLELLQSGLRLSPFPGVESTVPSQLDTVYPSYDPSLSLEPCSGHQSRVPEHQALLMQDNGLGHLQELDDAIDRDLLDIVAVEILSFLCSFITSKLSIVQVDYLRKGEIWDFDVPGYNNYFIGDTLHHNSGKTHTAAYETSLHLTGRYPDGWKGIRFDHPVDIWVVGETTFRVRDTIQVKLFGKLGQVGTGMIPLDAIEIESIIKKPGIPYAYDIVRVKHASGGYSSIQFFSFDQGREKFQGSSVHLVWLDEEPPEDIYNECRMRVLDTNGYILFTFTPLQGITPLYDSLIQDDNVIKVWLTVDDVTHLNEDALGRLYEGMSESEKLARKYGVATVGTGKVFQFEESDYTCEPFEIPRYWRRVGGLDIGLSHPTAAVAIAIDDESGCIYVYQEYSKSGSSPREHCNVLSQWGIEFAMDPTAWNRQIGAKESVARMYQNEGLRVFKGFHDVDPSITKIRTLMSEGRLWIFNDCTHLLKELRTYRTREGVDGKQKIVKVNDDNVDSFRYALMATAKASIMGKHGSNRPQVEVREWQPSTDRYSGY